MPSESLVSLRLTSCTQATDGPATIAALVSFEEMDIRSVHFGGKVVHAHHTKAVNVHLKDTHFALRPKREQAIREVRLPHQRAPVCWQPDDCRIDEHTELHSDRWGEAYREAKLTGLPAWVEFFQEERPASWTGARCLVYPLALARCTDIPAVASLGAAW